jgi:hypothetical protein
MAFHRDAKRVEAYLRLHPEIIVRLFGLAEVAVASRLTRFFRGRTAVVKSRLGVP